MLPPGTLTLAYQTPTTQSPSFNHLANKTVSSIGASNQPIVTFTFPQTLVLNHNALSKIKYSKTKVTERKCPNIADSLN